jgi:hypothetical protein
MESSLLGCATAIVRHQIIDALPAAEERLLTMEEHDISTV